MKHLHWLIAILLLAVNSAFAQAAPSGLEYKVKAVVLVNFAKYVRWPEKTFQSDDQPINVCVFGDNPFGNIFESENAPKEAQNRPLKVMTLSKSSTKDQIAGCQLLYWQKSSQSEALALLPFMQEKGILSVSDQKSDDSLISFVVIDEKVRFHIRYKAAQAVGFEMSSQLLKLATVGD